MASPLRAATMAAAGGHSYSRKINCLIGLYFDTIGLVSRSIGHPGYNSGQGTFSLADIAEDLRRRPFSTRG